MGEEEEYNVSFKDNRLYISQKGFERLSEEEIMYVAPNHIRLYCHHSRVFRRSYYGYCFEKACTQSKTEKPLAHSLASYTGGLAISKLSWPAR